MKMVFKATIDKMRFKNLEMSNLAVNFVVFVVLIDFSELIFDSPCKICTVNSNLAFAICIYFVFVCGIREIYQWRGLDFMIQPIFTTYHHFKSTKSFRSNILYKYNLNKNTQKDTLPTNCDNYAVFEAVANINKPNWLT